jgi:hypothetical protein
MAAEKDRYNRCSSAGHTLTPPLLAVEHHSKSIRLEIKALERPAWRRPNLAQTVFDPNLPGNHFAAKLIPSWQCGLEGKLVLTCPGGQVKILSHPGKGVKYGPLS